MNIEKHKLYADRDRHYIRFTYLCNVELTNDELKDIQTDFGGKHPAGYGFYPPTKTKTKDGYLHVWNCNASTGD